MENPPQRIAAGIVSFLILFVECGWLQSCSASRPVGIAVTHVTVLDATGAPPRPDFTVVISGTRIAAVGPSSSVVIPSRAKVFDGAGKFLVPGLADMHVHLTGAGEPAGSREFFLPLLVAEGITTVRDMGGKVEFLRTLRAEIESGERLGPQIFFTGPYLDGEPPSFQPAIIVRSAAETHQAVRRLKSQGVDFIKVQSRLSREAYFGIANECRTQGMRFVGHVPDTVSAAEASAAGQASIEHLTGVLLATSALEEELRREQLAPGPPQETSKSARERSRRWQRRLLDSRSKQKTDALLREFLTNQTWQVPTFPLLVHLGYLTPETDLTHDPRSRFLSSNLKQIWEQGRNESLEGNSAPDFSLREELLKGSLEIVGKMNAAGVPIMAGTDAAAPNVFPGFSLHEDLAYLVQAGLTPMQALQAATAKPAEFLGKRAEVGTIEAGKRADLLLLDANPLEDIRNTEKIRSVVLNGRWLERSDLDWLLANAQHFAASP
jgi:imidazolonepropionase-like amidohydrolase